MAIEWAPWFNVPMHRRLEVLSVAFFLFAIVLSGPIATIVMIYLLVFGSIYSKIICGAYLLFVCFDWRTGDRGGRTPVAWMRNLGVWKHCVNYFPLDLVKTADLPPDRNYLVCLFPHGFICIGSSGNFATGYSKWPKLFPGIRTRLTTMPANVLLPLQREIILSCGVSSASASSLRTLLTHSNDPNDKRNSDGCTSTAVGLVVGGMRETSYSYPNKYRFVVAKRRGFIRIALETGASLVPAISFGDNNTYRIVEIKSEFWKRLFKRLNIQEANATPGLINGRGFFQYSFGLLPIRQPVTTVIGAPIHLNQILNPSTQLLDEIHEEFCIRLNELFETHKRKYVENSEDIFLEFV